MSLILEALKKAERQHKLGEVPGIGSSQLPEKGASSRWLGFLLVSIVALAMLILGLYLGGGTGPAARPEPLAQEISQEPPPVISPAPEPEAIAPADSHPQATPAAEIAQPTPIIPAAEAEPPALPLPSLPPEPPVEPKRLAELPTGFVDRLPRLNIDIHSYDKQTRKRYVLINLEKYREGDYLAEGPLLSEIRPDGVVLEHWGERFFLPIGNR